MALTYNSTTDKWTDSFTINKQTGTTLALATNDTYVNGDIEFAIDVKTASPTFKGGAVSGTASATGTNCSIDSSNNDSGVYITARGSATRAEIQYESAINGWVNKSANANAYAASGATNLTQATYYINGVTINAPESGTRSFDITVPNGANDTITFTFTVDSNGNTVIT